jgi:hypothetical protein
MTVIKVQPGTSLEILWNLNSTKVPVWYQATVMKVHKQTAKYVVCNIMYTDHQDVEKGVILQQDAYGTLWKLAAGVPQSEITSATTQDIDRCMCVLDDVKLHLSSAIKTIESFAREYRIAQQLQL